MVDFNFTIYSQMILLPTYLYQLPLKKFPRGFSLPRSVKFCVIVFEHLIDYCIKFIICLICVTLYYIIESYHFGVRSSGQQTIWATI